MRQGVETYDTESYRRFFLREGDPVSGTEAEERTALISGRVFKMREEADAWVEEGLDCCDNWRFAYLDEGDAVIERYWRQADHGCCGSVDYEIVLDGRRALVGCNYGH